MLRRALGFPVIAAVLGLTVLIAGTHAQSISGEYKVGVLEPLTWTGSRSCAT
jgi:hypothetical protein